MINHLQKLFKKHTGLAISLLLFLLFYGGQIFLNYTNKMLITIEDDAKMVEDNKRDILYIKSDLQEIKKQNRQNSKDLSILIGKIDILERRI